MNSAVVKDILDLPLARLHTSACMVVLGGPPASRSPFLQLFSLQETTIFQKVHMGGGSSIVGFWMEVPASSKLFG